MAQQTTLKLNALPGPLYASFAGKEAVPLAVVAPTPEGRIYQPPFHDRTYELPFHDRTYEIKD